MKLQLSRDSDSVIEGFKTIDYSDPNKINELNEVIQNSCEYILANTVLDDFEIEESTKIMGTLVSKLRLGGSIVVIGHDINTLSKAVVDQQVGPEQISQLIKNKRSISTALNIVSLLSSMGLSISSVKYNQHLYEIAATREQ